MTDLTSRFGPSTLHQRDPRSALFDSYTGDRSSSGNRAASASPAASGGYTGYAGSTSSSGVGAPGGGGSGMMMGQVNGGFRSATPNSRYVYINVNE